MVPTPDKNREEAKRGVHDHRKNGLCRLCRCVRLTESRLIDNLRRGYRFFSIANQVRLGIMPSMLSDANRQVFAADSAEKILSTVH
jgi:hypothetical protein